MRTLTQRAEVLDLQPQTIIVDDTDTPMSLRTPTVLTILAGPSAGLDRMLTDPDAIVLPAQVAWEPLELRSTYDNCMCSTNTVVQGCTIHDLAEASDG